MLFTNHCSTTTFGHNISYPINENLVNNSNSSNYNERQYSSTMMLIPSMDRNSFSTKVNVINNSINSHTLDRQINSCWKERCKQRIATFFKRTSKPTTINNEYDSIMSLNKIHQQSTFLYDPELDLSEEYISLISKRLLTTLRESKIKHLSCDNLFLPCNHIRNIARQCLIMSAEEPFGIMGAQIKIKLTLLSLNFNSTIMKYLPLIRINGKQKTTFEIEIDLHEDTKVFTLRRFLPQMKMFKELKEKSSLYVSPRCLLVKKVFYKTAEPKRAIINSMI